MMWRIAMIALPMVVAGAFAQAAETLPLVADGEPLSLELIRKKGAAYVRFQPIAEAFEAKVETVTGNILSVCVEADICAFVPMDGSDNRVIGDGTDRLVAVAAMPELFRAHFDWDAVSDSLVLAPGLVEPETRVGKGDAMPEVTLPDMDGNPVSLSSFLGKKIVIYTWASW